MIDVIVNNQPHKISKELTIENLLQQLEIQKEGTAVAVNNSVVPRSEHENFKLTNGDNLEIIRAVGGG
jgi:sulfur carrier protein